MSYKVEAVAQLAQEIKAAGFRAFIAKSGTYGFYTDVGGTRVVCFQYDLGGFKFSGNYRSKSCGTGWVIGEISVGGVLGFAEAIRENPPYWATKGQQVKLTTLEMHLATYQQSSQYTEV